MNRLENSLKRVQISGYVLRLIMGNSEVRHGSVGIMCRRVHDKLNKVFRQINNDAADVAAHCYAVQRWSNMVSSSRDPGDHVAHAASIREDELPSLFRSAPIHAGNLEAQFARTARGTTTLVGASQKRQQQRHRDGCRSPEADHPCEPCLKGGPGAINVTQGFHCSVRKSLCQRCPAAPALPTTKQKASPRPLHKPCRPAST